MSLVDIIIFLSYLVANFLYYFLGYEPITKENAKTEFVRSAPKSPRILKKILLASTISFVITISMCLLEYYELFSLKEIFL